MDCSRDSWQHREGQTWDLEQQQQRKPGWWHFQHGFVYRFLLVQLYKRRDFGWIQLERALRACAQGPMITKDRCHQKNIFTSLVDWREKIHVSQLRRFFSGRQARSSSELFFGGSWIPNSKSSFRQISQPLKIVAKVHWLFGCNELCYMQ